MSSFLLVFVFIVPLKQLRLSCFWRLIPSFLSSHTCTHNQPSISCSIPTLRLSKTFLLLRRGLFKQKTNTFEHTDQYRWFEKLSFAFFYVVPLKQLKTLLLLQVDFQPSHTHTFAVFTPNRPQNHARFPPLCSVTFFPFNRFFFFRTLFHHYTPTTQTL